MGDCYRYGSYYPITKKDIREIKQRIKVGDRMEEYIRVEEETRQQVKKKIIYQVVGKYRHLVEPEPITGKSHKRESATYVEILMRERHCGRSSVRDIRLL